MSLFGTSGIRGDEEKLFTNQFCFDLGLTFAKFLENHGQFGPIAIGMDPRGSSPRISRAVQQGLDLADREILDQGASPTPAINYLLRVSPAAGGIMVTGSHIAAGLNGVKFFAFEEEITKTHEKEIEEIYQKTRGRNSYFQKTLTLVREENHANEEYEEMLVSLAKNIPPWKAIVDPGNGAQSEVMPRVFSRLGIKTTATNADLQGGFIPRDTETEGVLKGLGQKVLAEKADFGVAYDCDGDRAAFVDETGRFVPGDYTGALLSQNSNSPVVVTPISTSGVVDYLDKKVVRTKVGSPYVIAAMKENGAIFGFEANGGGISGEIMYSRDAGSTTIKILNLLAKTGKSLNQLARTLPQFFMYKNKLACPSDFNQKILNEAKKEFRGEKIEELDGIKIWLDKTTWILFRPSGNAPEFRVFAEAKTENAARALGENGLKLVKEIIRK
jgi:phosphomannomutase